jgi:uncharacterized protein
VSLNIVRCGDVAPQPWKNGGGVTRELLAWPSVGEWVLRLSVADIERDGPFSTFPGIDRWFAVLNGNGVWLGAPEQKLQPGDDAFNFDGALAPACLLIDGPTRDLNLMIRRDAASGWMKRMTAGFEFPVAGGVTSLSGVFAVDGCTLHTAKSTAIMVAPMSLVWCESSDELDSLGSIDCGGAALIFGFQCVVNL